MENDDDKTILICAATGTNVTPVYGSITGQCSECSCGVWVSPSGQALADIYPLCGACAQKMLEDEEEPVKIQLAPGSIEEALSHFRNVRNN